MWNIEPHLQKSEKIIYEETPAWISYLGVFIFGFLFIWTIVIPIIVIVVVLLHKYSTKYVVTNKRVIKRFGVLSEDFKSASFKHITSVSTRQSIIGKIFNFGKIITDTSGSGTANEFEWMKVYDPVTVKKIIEQKVK